MNNDERREPDSRRTDSDALELRGRLADAVDAIRDSPVEPALIERCRLAGLAAGEPRAVPNRIRRGWPGAESFAVAAPVFLMLNLFQAWMRMPISDRELAAVHVTRAGERLEIYSDLRVEPLAAKRAVNNRSE